MLQIKKSFNEDVDIVFDEKVHAYTHKGEKLLSGSKFVARFVPEFDAEKIAKNCEKKWCVPAHDIQTLWLDNGDTASFFGSAIHKGLENYFKHRENGAIIMANSKKLENAALPKHPILKKIILDFEKMVMPGRLLTEVFVTGLKKKLCGQLDLVLIVDEGKKICRVQDFKINVGAEDVEENKTLLAPFHLLPANKLTKYQIQLSFYAMLLEDSGWIVLGLDAYVLEDEWKHFELKNISSYMRLLLKKEHTQSELESMGKLLAFKA